MKMKGINSCRLLIDTILSAATLLPISSQQAARAKRHMPTSPLHLQEMASRHRVRAPCLQIIKTATVPAALTKRVNVKQFHDSKIKFPLTRRIARCEAIPPWLSTQAQRTSHQCYTTHCST